MLKKFVLINLREFGKNYSVVISWVNKITYSSVSGVRKATCVDLAN